MRIAALLPLLLLGILQAVITPDAGRDELGGHLRLRDDAAPTLPIPVDNPTALKRLSDGPRTTGLAGATKHAKGALAGAPCLVHAAAAASSRGDNAGQLAPESPHARAEKPRAPPPSPSC